MSVRSRIAHMRAQGRLTTFLCVFVSGLCLLVWGCQRQSESSAPPPVVSSPTSTSAPTTTPTTPNSTESTTDATPSTGSNTTAPAGNPELIAKGKTFYKVHCIQCHNVDPRKPGPIGPEIAGASLELIEARVLRLEYPPGYTPKRKTNKMLKQPHLKDKLPAIHAYINSF